MANLDNGALTISSTCDQFDRGLRPEGGSFHFGFPQGPVDTGKFCNESYEEYYEEVYGEKLRLHKDGWEISILVSGSNQCYIIKSE